MAKKKPSKQELKQSISIFKEFNQLSKAFLKLLHQKVAEKEKHISKIKFMVDDMIIPQKINTTLNIQTLDMNKTSVQKKGGFKYNQKMNWEEDLRKKRRGIIL